MKKLIVLSILVLLTTVGFSQGIFKPAVPFSTPSENNKKLSSGNVPVVQKWMWRIDATLAISELNYNKDTKQFISNSFSAVGPAIGYQHFVPTSTTDPTPFNNYGFSAAFLLGNSIYSPELASFKFALVANIMQYFKFGVTLTPNPATNVIPVGLFFGGGITF